MFIINQKEDLHRLKIKNENREIEIIGDKSFIETYFEKLESFIIGIEFQKEISEEIEDDSNDTIKLEDLTIAEFFKLTNPETNEEKILYSAYWLEKTSGSLEFEVQQIRDCYIEIQIEVPSNLARDIKSLTSGKKAYIISLDKRGFYKLTQTGRLYVLEKVKEFFYGIHEK